jgi:hypothetical protein
MDALVSLIAMAEGNLQVYTPTCQSKNLNLKSEWDGGS